MKFLRLTLPFLTAVSVSAQVVVNEIMYNPASHDAREEWVELLNTSGTNVNLSGWTISGGIDFAFPANTVMGPGRYLVVAAHQPTFASKFPQVTNVVGSWLAITVMNVNGRSLTNFSPLLSNSRNSVNLNNAAGDRVDSVTYADAGDWAVRRLAPPDGFGRRGWVWYTGADGLGSSLELRNPALPNEYGQNWLASPTNNPTPGAANISRSTNIAPLVVDVNHAPIIPRSTDPVTITARVIDESASGLTVTLAYRIDSASPPSFTPQPMFDDGAHGDASPNDGIYGFVLPAMFNNTLVEFYVEATDAQGNTRSWPAPSVDSATPHDANAMFQVDDTVYSGLPPTYKLVMTTAHYNELGVLFNNSPNSDAQVNATFISIDATGVEYRHLCGIRNRGHGSRFGTPHNYRVNFPDDTPWKGVSGYNLNARGVPAQVVGATVALKAGAAGHRARFVQLRVNNTSGPGGSPANGLYAGNEDIDGDWAERLFPNNSEGNIYSVVRDLPPSPYPNFDYRLEDVSQYRRTYVKQSNTTEDDWQDIMGMLFVMGENQTNSFDIDAARQVANVDQWLLHLAVMNLFGNNESGVNTGNNDDYYWYRGDKDPRFIFVYHDLDSVLGLNSQGANTDIFRATCCPISGDSEGTWRAMNFFMHHPEVEPLYYRTLQNLLDTTFSAAQFDAIVDSVFADFPALAGTATTVKNYMFNRRNFVQGVINGRVPPVVQRPIATVTGEPRSPTWRTSATLTVGAATHYQWRLNNAPYSAPFPVSTPITISGLANGSTNTVHVLGISNGVPQIGATVSRTWVVNTATPTVQLNELLARNVSAVNIGGNFPDLVELLNDGSSAVNIEGWRLTDNLANPAKYVFPPGASIAAGTYLVLSEDDLGFGFDANGEALFLFDASGTNVLDRVLFGPQLPDRSIGRAGTGGTWFLGQPSLNGPTVTVPTGSGAGVRINEWLAFGNASNPDDLIEFYNPGSLPVDLAGNYLADNPLGFPNRHRIHDLTFVGAGSFMVLTADGDTDNPDHVNFSLDADQGEIGFFSPQLVAIDCITYGPQRRGVSQGRCPDGGNTYRAQAITTFGFANLCPVPPTPPQMTNIISVTNTWRHLTGANLDGVNWQAPGYDDSSWPQGQPLIGNGAPQGEPIRTPYPNTPGHITYYFRSTFTYPSNLIVNSLQFSNLIDDGAVFYINGREVARFGMGPGPVTWSTLATRFFSGTPPWEGPLNIAPTNVQPGLNTIAVEVHQGTAQSGDWIFGTRLDGITAIAPGAAGLVINELLASNGSYTNLDGSTPDLVELYNPSTNAVDIGGMSFTDDLADPLRRWVIPSGTILGASGFVVFQFDSDKPASDSNAGFGLSGDGDRLYLLTAETQYVDSIEFGLQPEDYSIGRVPNASSNWVLNLPTLGTPNAAAPLGNLQNVTVNEWMPGPATGDDWFELHNPDPFPVQVSGCYLSDVVADPTRYLPIRNLSFLGAGTNAWKQFFADQNTAAGGNHVGFRLNNTAEGIIFSDPNGGEIDSISYSYQAPQIGISEGRLPDGDENRAMFNGTDSPGEANFLALTNIVISEVLSHTDPPFEDAIELHNLAAAPVDISGWWLSDSRRQLRKYQMPPNTTVPANGYAVIYEVRFNNTDTAAEAFALSSSDGDDVYLSPIFGNGALNGYRASANFGPAANGVSFGRFVNSENRADYPALTRHTFGRDNALTVQDFRTGTGGSNAYPIVGPVVFTEIMYHPPDVGGIDNVDHEFIELFNATANPVALYDPAHPTNTWRLRDAVDFNFPTNTTLAPSGHLIVVSFDPATNTAALNSFRTRYGINMILFGPYSGKLDNSDDSVELYRPDAPNPGGKVPYILVERVRYTDRAPWYPGADGLGHSLHRRSIFSYGNEATNWMPAAAAPGPSAAGDNDSDGMPNSWELAHGFNINNSADASQDADGDGFTNLQEYRAGTDPRSAQSHLRIGPISEAPDAIIIDFHAAAGITYSIIYRSEVHTGDWTKLIDIPAQSTTQWIRVFDPSPDPTRFYRLVTPSLP